MVNYVVRNRRTRLWSNGRWLKTRSLAKYFLDSCSWNIEANTFAHYLQLFKLYFSFEIHLCSKLNRGRNRKKENHLYFKKLPSTNPLFKYSIKKIPWPENRINYRRRSIRDPLLHTWRTIKARLNGVLERATWKYRRTIKEEDRERKREGKTERRRRKNAKNRDGGKSLTGRRGHLCVRWKARSHQSLSSLVRNRRQVFTFPRDGVQANRSKYTGRPTFYPIIPHGVEFLSWSFDQSSTDWEHWGDEEGPNLPTKRAFY